MGGQEYESITSGETHGTIGGGHFAYTPDQMTQIVNNWVDLANSYDESIKNSVAMIRISPPAEDFASKGFTGVANRSGQSYLTYCQHNRDYCLEQAQSFQDALDDYLGVEERTIIALTTAAEGGPQRGL